MIIILMLVIMISAFDISSSLVHIIKFHVLTDFQLFANKISDLNSNENNNSPDCIIILCVGSVMVWSLKSNNHLNFIKKNF